LSPASRLFSPVEMLIGGIKTVIVDPHNEIMPYWFGEFLRQNRSLIAVRIDAHHDMFHCCPTLPAREGRKMLDFLERQMPYIHHFSRSMVNEGNFTCPGFHYGVLGALYHFHPGRVRLEAYGRISGEETEDPPRTAEKSIATGGRWIFWNGEETQLRGDEDGPKAAPLPRRLSLSDFQRDMQDCQLPIAVGIDLDGLYGNDDRGLAEDIIPQRLLAVKRLLLSVSRPAFICIARSQTPRSYIPARAVDTVQEAALGMIRALYG
jgi:hypothetical protein